MADKKPIDPKKPPNRSAKAVRNPEIVAEPVLTEAPLGLLKKTLYAWKISELLLLLGGGILAGSIGFFAAILFEYFDTSDPLAPLLNNSQLLQHTTLHPTAPECASYHYTKTHAQLSSYLTLELLSEHPRSPW